MIVAAAIIFDGVVWTLPRPARHHHIIEAHYKVTHIGGSGMQGFLDDQGVFLGRGSACNHVVNCQQALRIHAGTRVLEWGDDLYSEDLW